MDYEKKYKEALGWMQSVYPTMTGADKEDAEHFFPELAESKNERIKKEILNYIKTGTYHKDWISWLEKQGEKIDAIENFDTEFEKQVSYLIASAINKEHEYNQGYVKWTANALLNYAKHELEKQGENNKWKPSKDEMDALYGLAYITNKMDDKKDEAITKLYQDLKREFFSGVSYENMFSSSPVDATIKLEKQGEQKPVDNIESSAFKDKLLELFQKFRWKGTPTNGDIIDYVDAHIQELIGTVQNNPWSEEDNEMLDSIIEEVRYIGDFPDYPTKEENELYDECLAKVEWLKSLKERVQPQPKQEWSKEDERIKESIITGLEMLKDGASDKSLIALYNKKINWLKSLRPQSQWKPSKEQMEALKSSTYCQNEQMSKVLFELYQDLKKL